MNCPCDLPTSGDLAYDCERLACQMTPHFCDLYQTRPNYRRAWDEGRGPSQSIDATAEQPVESSGPGTELKAILAKLHIKPGGCGCNRRAAEMDRRGPVWCRKNIDKIVGWLMAEAKKRKLPLANLSRPAIKLLIRWAIRRSEREGKW